MQKELEELRERVDALQARDLLTLALLRHALLTLPMPQLRGMVKGLDGLGEELLVKLLNRPNSDATVQAFEERRSHWLAALNEEIEHRVKKGLG